jgi:hypothetical protein
VTSSMGVVAPPSRGRTAKGRTNKSESSPRSPRIGPGSGARRTAAPPGYAPKADECRYVRIVPPRPAETLPMSAEINTSHTDKRCEKTLQEHPRSCKAPGDTPAGVLARPPRNSTTTRREGRLISEHEPLRVPDGYHRRGSRATVGDSRKCPLMTGGETLFRKIIKYKQTHEPQITPCVVATQYEEGPMTQTISAAHQAASLNTPRANFHPAQGPGAAPRDPCLRGFVTPAPIPLTRALNSLTRSGHPGQK